MAYELDQNKDKYVNGQIWKAEWPKCWTVAIMFCDCKLIEGRYIPQFITFSLGRHGSDKYLSSPGMFFCNLTNKERYLYTPKDLDIFLGKKAELLPYRLTFEPKREAFFEAI